MTAEIRAEGRALFENPVALATLRSRLLRYASRDLSDADAEDATQEALLGLLCALDRYRGASQIETYAHAMLRHKVVDVYRAHARELPCAPETLQALIDLSADVAPDSEPIHDPAEQVDARQQAQQFWTTLGVCLRGLPHRTRAMFELREVLSSTCLSCASTLQLHVTMAPCSRTALGRMFAASGHPRIAVPGQRD